MSDVLDSPIILGSDMYRFFSFELCETECVKVRAAIHNRRRQRCINISVAFTCSGKASSSNGTVLRGGERARACS